MNKMEDWKLYNYLSDRADPDEVAAVESWLSGDPSNREKLEEVRDIWRYTESMDELESVDIQRDWKQVKDRIQFGQEDGSGRNTNQADSRNPGGMFNLLNFNVSPLLKIAALIVIILIPTILLEKKFDFLGSTGGAWVSEATEELHKGLSLPDGSEITLNAHSEISYPGEFKQNKREVRLNGEALFDVVSLDEQPFLIYTGSDLVIEVIGTSFNVNSREGTVVVLVLSGMVSLYETGREKDKLLLSKGEEGRHSSQGFFKPDVPNPNHLSWVTEKLVFKDTPLGDVVKDLSNYSGRSLVIRGDKMEKLVLTSTFENQELEGILEEIKLVLNISYSVSDDTIILHPEVE